MQPFIRICCKLIMMWDPKQRLSANIHFSVKLVKFGNPHFDEFGTDSYETHIKKKFGGIKQAARLIIFLD